MQKYCKTIGALAAASALVAGNAMAEVEYEMHTGYSTDYIWRGIDRGDNLVDYGVDALVDLGSGFKWNVGMWGGTFTDRSSAMRAAIGDDRATGTEMDFYTGISKDFGPVTAEVGYIYYYYSGNFRYNDNQEVYARLSHDFGFMSASFTYYWAILDGDDISGWDNRDNQGYSELAFGKKWELSPCLALNGTSTFGFLADRGFQPIHWTNKLALDWGFVEHATISPFVAYSYSIYDEDYSMYAGSRNEFWGGVSLSVKF